MEQKLKVELVELASITTDVCPLSFLTLKQVCVL